MNRAREAERTTLTIVWSKATDAALRSYLGSRSFESDAISKFVEDAVKWQLFYQSVDQVRKAFSNVPVNELDGIIDKAVSSVRKRKRRQRGGRSTK